MFNRSTKVTLILLAIGALSGFVNYVSLMIIERAIANAEIDPSTKMNTDHISSTILSTFDTSIKGLFFKSPLAQLLSPWVMFMLSLITFVSVLVAMIVAFSALSEAISEKDGGFKGIMKRFSFFAFIVLVYCIFFIEKAVVTHRKMSFYLNQIENVNYVISKNIPRDQDGVINTQITSSLWNYIGEPIYKHPDLVIDDETFNQNVRTYINSSDFLQLSADQQPSMIFLIQLIRSMRKMKMSNKESSVYGDTMKELKGILTGDSGSQMFRAYQYFSTNGFSIPRSNLGNNDLDKTVKIPYFTAIVERGNRMIDTVNMEMSTINFETILSDYKKTYLEPMHMLHMIVYSLIFIQPLVLIALIKLKTSEKNTVTESNSPKDGSTKASTRYTTSPSTNANARSDKASPSPRATTVSKTTTAN